MNICKVCNNEILEPIISFPKFPLTDIYTKTKAQKFLIDQEFYFCENCGHSQLGNSVNPNILYGSLYSFRTSKGGSQIENQIIKSSIPNGHFDNIIEIGCNDLYLLKQLKNKADKLIGIDPILEEDDDKIVTIKDFAENVDFSEFKGKSLVITNHFLEHVEQPKILLESLIKSINKNSIFLFGFPCYDILLEQHRFDQIYNHHLQYFSHQSFNYLLKNLGCKLIFQSFVEEYWGTMITMFKIGDYKKEKKKCPQITQNLIESKYEKFRNLMKQTIRKLDDVQEKIYGYGAGLQIAALNYHLKGKLEHLEYILDDDKDKDGLYFLNLDVPIKYSDDINLENKNIIITAINFSKQITEKLKTKNTKKIICPFDE